MVAFETPLKAVLCLIERKRLVLTSCMAFCTSSSWSAIDRPIIEGVVWSWRRRVAYYIKARKMARQAVWLAKWSWPLVSKTTSLVNLTFLLFPCSSSCSCRCSPTPCQLRRPPIYRALIGYLLAYPNSSSGMHSALSCRPCRICKFTSTTFCRFFCL